MFHRLIDPNLFIPHRKHHSFFDAGKNGDGIPDASADEDDEAAALEAAAEAAAEAEFAASLTDDDWKKWVADALSRDSFKITKTSKKGNTRKVDLRPQLLDLSHMDQREIDAALEGRRVPVPKTPPAGTAILRFKGEYTGAGGLSVEGMCQMLSAAAGRSITPLHSHRVGINLGTPTPPAVDKMWLDNIAKAEAFMALERKWDPAAGENNRGHMGGGNTAGDRIDNHKSYRKDEELPPGRKEAWKKM